MLVKDVFEKYIEITKERWQHACAQHPELEGNLENVKQTLQNPDVIKLSRSDRFVRLYYKFFSNLFGGKYIIAVIKSNKRSFLMTAYVTDYIKTGEELWKGKF